MGPPLFPNNHHTAHEIILAPDQVVYLWFVSSATGVNVEDGAHCDCFIPVAVSTWLDTSGDNFIHSFFLVTSYLLSQITYSNVSLSPCGRLRNSSTLENSLPDTRSRDSGLKFKDNISITFLYM